MSGGVAVLLVCVCVCVRTCNIVIAIDTTNVFTYSFVWHTYRNTHTHIQNRKKKSYHANSIHANILLVCVVCAYKEINALTQTHETVDDIMYWGVENYHISLFGKMYVCVCVCDVAVDRTSSPSSEIFVTTLCVWVQLFNVHIYYTYYRFGVRLCTTEHRKTVPSSFSRYALRTKFMHNMLCAYKCTHTYAYSNPQHNLMLSINEYVCWIDNDDCVSASLVLFVHIYPKCCAIIQIT